MANISREVSRGFERGLHVEIALSVQVVKALYRGEDRENKKTEEKAARMHFTLETNWYSA